MKLLLILLLLTHHLSAQVTNDNKLNKVEFYFIHINRCYAEPFSDSAIINRCNAGTDGSNKFTIKDSLTLLKIDSVLNIKSKFTTILNDTFYCDEKQNLDGLYLLNKVIRLYYANRIITISYYLNFPQKKVPYIYVNGHRIKNRSNIHNKLNQYAKGSI